MQTQIKKMDEMEAKTHAYKKVQLWWCEIDV
jgi:hypothetical protein